MEELSILKKRIKLQPLTKMQLKGITIGDTISYKFYDGTYFGTNILFIKPKSSNPTPRECAITANRLSDIFKLPIVYILESAPSYERQRLIDKNVYFVMGNNFAFLPMLIANERIRKAKPAKRLTPVAQYILLYHLQIESLEGLSIADIADKTPYSYESISLGLTCLSDLKICNKTTCKTKFKIIHFTNKNRNLWDIAQVYLINPVKKRVYCDKINSDLKYPICNINALSHYSRLNPDNIEMVMMCNNDFQYLQSTKSLQNENQFDGSVMIEIWKYPIISKLHNSNQFVDRLSLVLSLKEENDARIEKETERIINEIKWTD